QQLEARGDSGGRTRREKHSSSDRDQAKDDARAANVGGSGRGLVLVLSAPGRQARDDSEPREQGQEKAGAVARARSVAEADTDRRAGERGRPSDEQRLRRARQPDRKAARTSA